MSTLALATLLHIAGLCPAMQTVPGDPALFINRVRAHAMVESKFQPLALHDNTSGRSYLPATEAGAKALAGTLWAAGHSLDGGVMQLTSANWSRFGLTPETVFDPQRNICAGVTVLAEAYAADWRAACRYNTGKPDCHNGYPEKVERVLASIQGQPVVAEQAPTAPGCISNPSLVRVFNAGAEPAAPDGGARTFVHFGDKAPCHN